MSNHFHKTLSENLCDKKCYDPIILHPHAHTASSVVILEILTETESKNNRIKSWRETTESRARQTRILHIGGCVRSASAQEAEGYGKSETTALRPVSWISHRFPWTHAHTHLQVCVKVNYGSLETNTFVTFIDICTFLMICEAAVSARVHSALTVCSSHWHSFSSWCFP